MQKILPIKIESRDLFYFHAMNKHKVFKNKRNIRPSKKYSL